MTRERLRPDTLPSRLPPALLEEWMREFYFSTEIDIGSSGVENFSVDDLSRLLGFSLEELRPLVLEDSLTLGGSGLREALGERFLAGDGARAMATHGSSEANFLLSHALLGPGDEVVASDPIYPQLASVAASIGCRLRRWPLRFERGYRPDLDELRRLLDQRTRMVIVNFPHNPTGASLTPAEQAALLDEVARAGAYLVWDCAFSELQYEAPPISQRALLEYERSVTMGTLSKAYGLPGLRVGWCLAAPPILERLIRVRDYVTLHMSPLVEWFAERVIRSADRLLALRIAQARRNLEVVAAWIGEHQGEVGWVRPQGGVTAFPRLALADSEPLCRQLAEEHSVLLVPGNCFDQPRHVRLGFGCATAELREGLRRLSVCLSEPAGVPATTLSGRQRQEHHV
ncbi:MAG TPA: capreomycidine synthase [Thermoanaerobaculia bacterium]|jgi:capreomycidine synthase|nr:capreomycidine synthase [Thermoanaerobaculia bacterium]